MSKLDPHLNLEDTLDMTATIVEARNSIKRIEGTTSRINKIVNDVATPALTHQTRHAKKKDEEVSFSTTFISFVLVLIITVLGLFGVIFFKVTENTSSQIDQLTKHVARLEQHSLSNSPTSPGSGK